MTLQRFMRAVEVLNRRQPDLTVVTDKVHKGQNLSAIVRTCDANGVMTVHSVYDRATFKAHTGTSMGSQKWVDTIVYQDIKSPLDNLKYNGYQIVAADTSGDTLDYREVDFTRPTAVVLGAEKVGLSPDVGSFVDHRITIPMMGMVESFNVSVACAVILSEARRQREIKGLYESRQISDVVFEKKLLEWTQPLIARYCDKHKLAYPKLNDVGDIIDKNWREIKQ
ncbi:MAG TPA: tRNA (guanosine(18)-2'-O)-methyltransferase TrmH [Porticoccaceae bacterium]|jgi:tRNA (guanosine-2'-O-)-methyltransferase|nr:tRNA (guanosine(18)-2'-O)-methyltransferase TrmH [Porticoccaceae bacterium]